MERSELKKLANTVRIASEICSDTTMGCADGCPYFKTIKDCRCKKYDDINKVLDALAEYIAAEEKADTDLIYVAEENESLKRRLKRLLTSKTISSYDTNDIKTGKPIRNINDLDKDIAELAERRKNVGQAREDALISAYKTISKVLDGSKNGPELISAIPIAEYAAKITKMIEDNRDD